MTSNVCSPINGPAWVGADGVLLVKRAGRGLLGGLWTPPLVLDLEGQPPEAALIDAFARAGVRVACRARLGEVGHVFSHRRLTAEVFAVERTSDTPPEAGEGWSAVRFASPDVEGLSTLARKILAVAEDPEPETQLSLLAADGAGS